MINALEIFEKLRKSVGNAAVQFYIKEFDVPVKNTNDFIQHQVLQQGGTNFDEKYTDNPKEEDFYKTDAYIWQYMDMHIKHNLVVLKKYLGGWLKNNNGNILFVDLGCGPITSGLVLAEIISKQKPNYQENTYYLGIDASENMRKSAQYINKNYSIFSPDKFEAIQAITFRPDMVESFLSNMGGSSSFDIAILNMSFVLAPNTNKASNQKQWIKDLAQAWDEWAKGISSLKETRAIYLNPNSSGFHYNWDNFQRALKENSTASNGLSYSGGKKEEFTYPDLSKPVIGSQIIGKR